MAEYHSLRDHDGKDDDHDDGQNPPDWKSNMASFFKKSGDTMNVVGGKLSEQVNVVGDRMKELFYTPTFGERLVDEATSDVLIGPDWSKNLQICDLVNATRVPSVDVVRGVKRRLSLKNGHVQILALAVLETALKNCANMFSDVAAEKVLDVMVRIVDDPTSPSALREKCLKLIEAWGEATEELHFLPVFEETYKSLKTRGIVFPPRDPESLAPIFTPPQTVGTAMSGPHGHGHPTAGLPVDVGVPTGVLASGGSIPFGLGQPGLTAVDTPQGSVIVLDSKEILSVARNSTELLSTVLTSAPPEEVLKDEVTLSLAAQCRASKRSVQQLVENESSNETLLFEALTVNDELDKVLEKLAELQKQARPTVQAAEDTPAAAAPAIPAPAAPTAQPADLLGTLQAAPGAPTPISAFAVPSGEHEPDGGEALVRRRVGVEGSTQQTDDESVLAGLDAMVFGGAPAPAPAPTPAPAPASAPPPVLGSAPAHSTSAQGTGAQGSQPADKKEDDLIVF